MADADVIIIGTGLAGLVAACELVDRGKRVLMLDQESAPYLGGQAFWSLGGLFMVDTPEQRRMGIRDSPELALSDWMGSAQFDRPKDHWPREWAKAYLEFSASDMRGWLHGMGMRWFPVVGWAERGGAQAHGHGNSVPRFHLTWGTGPGVVEPFEAKVRAAMDAGKIEVRFRHRVTGLTMHAGAVTGVTGEILCEDAKERGAATSRDVIGDFELEAGAVIVASGGIGGNHEMVRQHWPVERLGTPPTKMISGVPEHVDGLMIDIAEASGASTINRDRMWHYTEGVQNYDPIWPKHGIRILPGPSPLWFDGKGDRFEAPYLPGFDTLGTLKKILSTGFEYSWFILTQKIIEKEFALSGSEQNEDFTSKSWKLLLQDRLSKGSPKAVQAFVDKGEDFVSAATLEDLVGKMNRLAGSDHLDADHIRRQIEARDLQVGNKFAKDAQVTAIYGARKYRGDKLIRTAKPHRILDPAAGPLIAVKLNILTRKSLGGLHTDLEARALDASGAPIPGLFAVGEAAGFGGGGYHGYNALEGTFLGGCIFSGRAAGRACE